MKNLIILLFIGSCVLARVPEREATWEQIKQLEGYLKTSPENTQILKKLGIIYHRLAEKGDKKAVKQAESLFKKLLQLEPKNAEVLSWYGSILTMKGRDAWLPFFKIKYVNDGLKEMDKAVKLAPNNITVRMVRAETCLALPENIFRQTEIAVADLEYLLRLGKEQPNN